MAKFRPDLDALRVGVGPRSRRAQDPDVGDGNYFSTPIENIPFNGRWKNFVPGTWKGAFGAGPSRRRPLVGTTVSTTTQYRGANLTPYGARGVWTGWPSASSAGSTYQLKAGAGPLLSSSFVSGYGTTEVDYLIGKGCNFFRILINHEAAQPDPSALAIPYAGSFTNASRYSGYWAAVKSLVDYCVLTKGCTVVLDLHNAENEMVNYYNQRFRQSPGAGEVNSSILVDFWTRMATIFSLGAYGGKVWFGLHNEPNQGDGSTIANWFPIVQDCITGIRSTGNTGKILVPGLNFTSSREYIYNGSYKAFRALTDFANNLAIQVHFYYDTDNSGANTATSGAPDIGMTFGANSSYEPKDRVSDGTAASAGDVAAARLRGLAETCRDDGVEIYMTEIAFSTKNAAGADQTSLAATYWRATVDFLNTFADVIKGYCWWESNGIPGHHYSIDLNSGVESPMMTIIKGDFVPRVTKPLLTVASFTDPLSLGASLGAWWSPSNNTNTSGAINTVLDYGPNGYTLSKVSTGPIYSASSANLGGAPSISTTAANTRIQNVALTSTSQPWWFLWTIFVSTNTSTQFYGSNGGNYTGAPGFTRQTDTFGRWRDQTTTSNVIGGGSSATLANGINVVMGVYDGANSLAFINVHDTPSAAGTMDNNPLTAFTIGSFGSAVTMEWGNIFFGLGRPSSQLRRNAMRWAGNQVGFTTQ